MQSQIRNADRETTSITVDFGGTKISAARILDDAIVDRRKVATDQEAAPQVHLETIAGLIEDLGVEQDAGLGVAVCGRVDCHGNWRTLNNSTLKGFSTFPLRAELEARFDRPVNIVNDAIAAAWGEYCRLVTEEPVESLLYITVSTGVGGGIVVNGRPLTSADGLATHLGFTTSFLGSERCGSGRFGTLESVAAGTAIARAGAAASGQDMSGYGVYQAHLAGESFATTAVDRSAHAIAKAIADVRALLGVQVAVIGGSVGSAEGYIDLVRRHIDEEPELFRPRIEPARLDSDSALYGVARWKPASNR